MLVDLTDEDLYASPYYQNVMNAAHRHLVIYGSRDSAKSYSIAEKIIQAMMEESYCKVVLVRKIGLDIRDSQFQTILDVIFDWGVESLFDITYSNMRIKLKGSRNVIIARGLDKPTRLKSIKDPTIIWIEEANEITKTDFINTNLSIRGPEGCLKQIILSFNPEDEASWINEYFFPPKKVYEKDDGNFHVIKSTHRSTAILHTTFRDNKFCPPERMQVYEDLKRKSPEVYRTACLGLWGGGKKGIIFENVNFVREFPAENERTHYGFGLDFGFTNDPTALIECCIAHGEVYVREKIYRTGLVNTHITPGVPSIEKELERLEVFKSLKINADSAEPKSIAEIKARGYSIRGIEKPKGSVNASITGLLSRRINIVGGSPNLKKEQKNYCWELDDNGNPTNVPIDAFNHGWDAVRYWYMGQVLTLQRLVAEVM